MITDDALMAYLDGEADPARASEIEAALAADATLRARLETMAARDATVRAAFDGLLERPVPGALADRVRAAAAASGNVVTLDSRRRPPQRWAWVAGALAAQAAMLAGAVLLLAPSRDVQAPQAAYRALSADPVAQSANVMIMFRPDTQEAALRETLASVEGRVVGGPNTAGAWLVRVPEGRRDEAVARLARRAEVRLAEPVDAR